MTGMDPIAQTNIQLYNQLRAQGYSLEDQVLVHRAYGLVTSLYTGYFQADGKPFVNHGVGVASIMAHLGRPADVVAAGLLHNVYGNGDFGDGRHNSATPSRRRLLRRGAGERIEALVYRFDSVRLTPKRFDEMSERLETLDQDARDLVLIDIADCLEKYVDLGLHYYGDNAWVTPDVTHPDERFVDIARRLGYPAFAERLSLAFREAAATAGDVPEALRSPEGQSYLALVVPRSCFRRPHVALMAYARRRLWRLRKTLGRRRGTPVPGEAPGSVPESRLDSV
jgi:(p)ppGpp synthase/HD superfamily hydrolase